LSIIHIYSIEKQIFKSNMIYIIDLKSGLKIHKKSTAKQYFLVYLFVKEIAVQNPSCGEIFQHLIGLYTIKSAQVCDPLPGFQVIQIFQ